LTAPLDEIRPKGIWKSPVVFHDLQSSAGKAVAGVSDRFYVYACAEMRAGPGHVRG
jgi:hypothetical protein